MIYWLCQRQGSSCHPRVTDAFLVIKRIKEVIRSIFCCELKCVATDQLPRHNLWYYPSLYTIQINYSSSSYILHTWKLLMRTKYCFHSYHVRKSHTRSLIRLLVLPNQYLFFQDELFRSLKRIWASHRQGMSMTDRVSFWSSQLRKSIDNHNNIRIGFRFSSSLFNKITPNRLIILKVYI